MLQLEYIDAIERRLWNAADQKAHDDGENRSDDDANQVANE